MRRTIEIDMPSILLPSTGMMIDSSRGCAASFALKVRAARAFSSSRAFIQDRAVPDQVIRKDDGAWARQLQAQIEIGRVARFVGIDEDQIEWRDALLDETLHRLSSRTNLDRHAPAHAGAIDVSPRDVGVLGSSSRLTSVPPSGSARASQVVL